MTTNDRDLVRERVLGEEREPARVLQWVGFLLAPLVFFAHLQIAYLLVPWACARQQQFWMYIAGAIAVLPSLAPMRWRLAEQSLEPVPQSRLRARVLFFRAADE
jgi:hypothetical protein